MTAKQLLAAAQDGRAVTGFYVTKRHCPAAFIISMPFRQVMICLPRLKLYTKKKKKAPPTMKIKRTLLFILNVALLSACASPYMDAIMAMPDGPAKVAALNAARADADRRTAQLGAAVAAGLAGAAAGAAAAAYRPPVIVQPYYYQPYYYHPYNPWVYNP